jgi:hypothetical protein
MIEWPSTLPQHPTEPYDEQPGENVIETQNDVGPMKRRRRFTAVPTYITLELSITKTQAADLDTFYRVTTAHGTLPFEWTHPRTGATVMMRFRNPPPLYHGFHYKHGFATINLEVLP